MAEMNRLPKELLVTEIFGRLDFQSIARCRPVCSEWNNMLYSSELIKSYGVLILQTEDASGSGEAIVLSCKDFRPPADERLFPQLRGNILAGHEGFFIWDHAVAFGRLSIFDHESHTWVRLPMPFWADSSGMESYAMRNMYSNPISFKIARVFNKINEILFIAVFDSDRVSWDAARGGVVPQLGWNEAIHPNSKSPVVAGRFAYWFTTHSRLLRFDFEDEVAVLMDLPFFLREQENLRLIKYQGKLGVLALMGFQLQDVSLWLYHGGVWMYRNAWPITFFSGQLPALFISNEEAVVIRDGEVEVLNICTGQSTSVPCGNRFLYALHLCCDPHYAVPLNEDDIGDLNFMF